MTHVSKFLDDSEWLRLFLDRYESSFAIFEVSSKLWLSGPSTHVKDDFTKQSNSLTLCVNK